MLFRSVANLDKSAEKYNITINPNHVKFLLGFIKSKSDARTEDYERALDTLFWAISSGKITKQEFGKESFAIGKKIQEYYAERDRELAPGARAELRAKKEGKAPDIAPKYEEGNVKCYHIPKVDSNLNINDRHKLLCKYGKIGRAHV